MLTKYYIQLTIR